MNLRPEVQRFAELMETKLSAHDETRRHWRAEAYGFLVFRLIEEVGELTQALRADASPSSIAYEAADVANFAMMIAHNTGGLTDASD